MSVFSTSFSFKLTPVKRATQFSKEDDDDDISKLKDDEKEKIEDSSLLVPIDIQLTVCDKSLWVHILPSSKEEGGKRTRALGAMSCATSTPYVSDYPQGVCHSELIRIPIGGKQQRQGSLGQETAQMLATATSGNSKNSGPPSAPPPSIVLSEVVETVDSSSQNVLTNALATRIIIKLRKAKAEKNKQKNLSQQSIDAEEKYVGGPSMVVIDWMVYACCGLLGTLTAYKTLCPSTNNKTTSSEAKTSSAQVLPNLQEDNDLEDSAMAIGVAAQDVLTHPEFMKAVSDHLWPLLEKGGVIAAI